MNVIRLTLLAAAWIFMASSGRAADRLNVLMITLDDMNWDTVGAFGGPISDVTPNIDKLASQGMRFEHAHVTIAICQPTRAVWMTGRYPHNNGALGFNHITPGVPTLPEKLRENGYLTGILGKTEHVVPSRKDAFDYKRDRSEMNNGRSAVLYAKFADEFLAQSREAEKPFFFMVNAHDPHRPFDNRAPAAERKTSATKQANSKQANSKASRNAKQDAKAGKGKKKNTNAAQKRGGGDPAPSKIYQPEEIVVPPFLPDLPPIREEIAQYYSSSRRADDVVGAVLQSLRNAGFDKNTLVMCMSDHGIAVPFAKTNVWQNSTRTPWIVRWPETVKAGAVEKDHLIAGVDLAPTILDALGVKPMEGMDGGSFLPVLRGKKQAGRECVYTHINTIASKRAYPMRSAQDARFGLIWNGWSDGETTFRNESQAGLTWRAMTAAAKSDPKIAARVKFYSYRTPLEFYDYQQDPHALNNLIDDPASQERVKVLAAK
ncbi:MAG: sulfatase, partial [Planctomycetales bacterium]